MILFQNYIYLTKVMILILNFKYPIDNFYNYELKKIFVLLLFIFYGIENYLLFYNSYTRINYTLSYYPYLGLP